MSSERRRRPRVLFVCTKNACRSQMAEGLARAAFGGVIDVASAGARPSLDGGVDPGAVAAMAEASALVPLPRARSWVIVGVWVFD